MTLCCNPEEKAILKSTSNENICLYTCKLYTVTSFLPLYSSFVFFFSSGWNVRVSAQQEHISLQSISSVKQGTEWEKWLWRGLPLRQRDQQQPYLQWSGQGSTGRSVRWDMIDCIGDDPAQDKKKKTQEVKRCCSESRLHPPRVTNLHLPRRCCLPQGGRTSALPCACPTAGSTSSTWSSWRNNSNLFPEL